LAFDGVFVRKSYDYNKHTGYVLGRMNTYTIEEFLKLSKEKVTLNAGREIFQVFLQSMERDFYKPIGHIVIPDSQSPTFLQDFIMQCV
jgi:hypothetical protein